MSDARPDVRAKGATMGGVPSRLEPTRRSLTS